MPTRPDRSLVIVNWNTRERLIEALDSLAPTALPPTEILVVDNASTDDSVARARAHPVAPRVIVRPRNDGFAAGVNTGLLEARGTVVILLNSDARVEPGAVDRLV
ncbi:MAG: glycosyl transferase family protein, partial [bacterium]